MTNTTTTTTETTTQLAAQLHVMLAHAGETLETVDNLDTLAEETLEIRPLFDGMGNVTEWRTQFTAGGPNITATQERGTEFMEIVGRWGDNKAELTVYAPKICAQLDDLADIMDGGN